jgi:alkylation response protein AidB-like acyl-CoA dehydrogenase
MQNRDGNAYRRRYMEKMTGSEWIDLVHELGKEFAKRSATHDREESFVSDNYEDLKRHRFFAAAIPAELGGGGVPHTVMCDILRTMARYCGSTALAHSMHQHLVAATVWKYRQGQGGAEMLKKVAESQPVLVSTGAKDWLESNGTMEKTDAGYVVTATKHFASQSAVGNILVSSAPYLDPEAGWQVLHFSVPFTAAGVEVLDDWHTMGMRGTGSHTVRLREVVVPESSITLRRPRGTFHPFWNVILTVAMPLIMSVYVGIAREAAAIAIASVRGRKEQRPHDPPLVGAMSNELISAELHLKDMIRIANNLDFKPEDRNGVDILSRKTNVANACIGVVGKAMDVVGGQGYYQGSGLERCFRDVQASKHHPLPEQEQQQFCGEFVLREA